MVFQFKKPSFELVFLYSSLGRQRPPIKYKIHTFLTTARKFGI